MSLLFLLAAPAASAFCGTYVGSPGAGLVNRSSQVVVARQGDLTTLTLVADVTGDAADFALLMPVPVAVGPSDVRVVDPAVVDRLDRYSAPRLVSYGCDDAVTLEHLGAVPGCAGMAVGCAASTEDPLGSLPEEVVFDAATAGVTVQAAFTAAAYEIVVLTATGADGLYAWLDASGFAVPAGGEEVLQEYLDAGNAFLAARVRLDAPPEEAARLPPLQVRYRSADWTLPIRIGTISARGEQEVVVYALTDEAGGDVAIANYPELSVEDECLWRPEPGEDLAGFYREALADARPAEGPGWQVEYAWVLYRLEPSVKCDPCTVEAHELYDPGELAELGFVDQGGGPLLTRLRMVYDPAEATQDLLLYTTGAHPENRQIRYVADDRRLEFLFPVCGQGYLPEPGSCGDGQGGPRRDRACWPVALGLVGVIGALGLRRTR